MTDTTPVVQQTSTLLSSTPLSGVTIEYGILLLNNTPEQPVTFKIKPKFLDPGLPGPA